MSTVHWTRHEYEDDNDRVLIEVVRRGRGICAGMSYEWLRGQLEDNKPINSMPSLSNAIRLQNLYKEKRGRTLRDYASFGDLELIHWEQINTLEEALLRIWTYRFFPVSDRRPGIVIYMRHPDRTAGHAAAFMKSATGYYFMRPNNGLVSCVSLTVLTRCFREGRVFTWLERNPHHFIVSTVARTTN